MYALQVLLFGIAAVFLSQTVDLTATWRRINMAITCYSAMFLKQGNVKPLTLDSSTYQRIKTLDLLRPDIVTSRGNRAGVCKERMFDSITGVKNLTVVEPVNMLCEKTTPVV
jgi:hypothetical protein